MVLHRPVETAHVFGNYGGRLADLPNSHSATGLNPPSTSIQSLIPSTTSNDCHSDPEFVEGEDPPHFVHASTSAQKIIKNKLEKVGVFFRPKKRGSKPPQKPHIQPQIQDRKST